MADRIFAELENLSNEMAENKHDYLQKIQQTPPPWTIMQKASFQPDIQELQGNLDDWKENIAKLEAKANVMRNDDDAKAEMFTRIDTVKNTKRALIKDLKKIILQGNSYINVSIPEPVQAVAPANPSALKISSLNIQKFNAIPRATSNAKSIRFTVNSISNMCRQLENYGIDIDNNALQTEIIDKMPPREINELKWYQLKTDNVTTEMLLEMMKDIALKAEMSNLNFSKTSSSPPNNFKRPPTTAFQNTTNSYPNQNTTPRFQNHNVGYPNSIKKFACSFCDKDHSSVHCPQFVTAEDRIQQLKQKNCCTKCARNTHLAHQCQSNIVCKNCQGPHYPFLCKQNDATLQIPKKSNAFLSIGAQQGCLLTKRITVMNPITKETADATVFFDSGSQRSYISDKFINQLKLPRENQERLNIQGIGAKATSYISSLVKLQIKTTDNFEEIYANSIKTIANTVPVISFDGFDTSNFTVTNYPPDILIGMDYFFNFITSYEKRDKVVIVNSKVGQMLSGNINARKEETISALSIEPTKLYNFDDEIQNLWKLEAMGIQDHETDENESQILEKFKESIQFKNNRFYVSWPTKPHHKPLPTNEGLSLGRLNSTLKKVTQDLTLFNEYKSLLDKQFEQGKIEIAPTIPQGDIVHYLPHHAVITPEKTTTKVRMVFDGSAKSSKDAPSLNECLVRGPLKVPDLCGILFRIRTKKYLLMGDIEKAFHQICLNETARDAVRFFWIKDPSKPAIGSNLIIYRFVVIPFGIICSPFILWIIILILIQKLQNVLLRKMINDNTYVDNLFLISDDEDEGIQLFKETRNHFLTASMNVREWLSNSNKINECFPSEIKQSDPIAKILGIQWNSQADVLLLKLSNKKQFLSWTKRNISKFIASSFDPLGMLTPVTMKGKAFLQKLFKQGYPWDKSLNKELQYEWQTIVDDWNGEIQIPRRLVQGTMPSNEQIEIHAFGDASQTAYCACVFLRIKTSTGYVTPLVFAKTKLQPLNKDLTIPKMEVMGIWLAAKIASFVAKEFKIESSKKFVWTDSQISTYWYKKLPKNVFVTNRLKAVLESNVELLFVPGKMNPADLGTRGISFDELQTSKCWWQGPAFLQHEEKFWPKLPQGGVDLIQTITALISLNATKNTVTLQNIELEREYEIDTNLSWTDLKKKISMHVKNTVNEQSLTAKDLMQIENMLIKQEQEIYISPEIEKHLKLAKNDNGIYCINTRFDHAELINKNPIFLPKNSPLTKMIVMDIHLKLHHSGVPHTLSKVRETYWIPSGRFIVQRIISKCKSCKIWKAKPFVLPNMPQLPATRVNKSSPFQNVGIDYAGPFKIKGVKEKSWIILFTCFTTRLIHLEPVTSMASIDFLQCFRRFISRRGLPHFVLSDNAKQFKTTSTTLDKIWKESIQDKQAINFFNENGIVWEFITERAPWKGGLYERLVSLVKNAIKQTLGHQVLNFNEFWTFLNEVESTINSRPITYVHSKESFVIRPIDFITPKIEIRLPATATNDYLNDPTYLPTNSGGGECLAEQYYKTIQYLDKFWELWSKDYLNLLRERNNDIHKNARGAIQRHPIVNEKVIVFEPDIPRGNWKTAEIKKLIKSSDNQIRSVELKYDDGFVTRRALNHLYPLEENISEGQNDHFRDETTVCQPTISILPQEDNTKNHSFACLISIDNHSPIFSSQHLSLLSSNSDPLSSNNLEMANIHELSFEPSSSSSEGETYEEAFKHLKVLNRVVVVVPDPNKVRVREIDELLKKLNNEVLEVKNQQKIVLKLVIQAIDEYKPISGKIFEGIKDSLSESQSVSNIVINELASQFERSEILDKIINGLKAVNNIQEEKVDLQNQTYLLRTERRELKQ
uniref:Integrase catalytic domain-containing protein n=1 Tax=Panagrolaimus superbus TaxID=310955 RepID=A0A914Z2Y1_9BILA